MSLSPDWPHQTRTLEHIASRFRIGGSMCLQSPTGSGKSRIMARICQWGKPTIIYANRKVQIIQLRDLMKAAGLTCGVRAASFPEWEDLYAPLQIAMDATDHARSFKKYRTHRHNAEIVFVEEAHLGGGGRMKEIREHYNPRAFVVGVTATPVGLSNQYDEIYCAATLKELREQGALVPAKHFGFEEMDTSNLTRNSEGEFVGLDGKLYDKFAKVIVGHVVAHYEMLNPERRPTILFAPGVRHSLWFAQQFCEAGHRFAHIDGETVWLDGQTYRSEEKRDEVLNMLRTGEIKGVCNRFVLREALDIPELYHCILACPIGSLASYIQVGGRVIRAHHSTPHVVIQDHGGNWSRHGSINADRDWNELWAMTPKQASELHQKKLAEQKENEGICCPKCGQIRMHGDTCHNCGFMATKSVRLVVELDGGRIREVEGPVTKPRHVTQKPETLKHWEKVFFRCKNSKRPMTYSQAMALFVKEHHYYPPMDLRYMPKNPADFSRHIRNVPRQDCH